jgi:CRISPR-associated protein Csh2
MTQPFDKRTEFLFVYEAVDCNPNGDPLDENRPRTDPETGVCTVTDVRIKRTIRDEILSWEPDVQKRIKKGQEILIRDTHVEDGFLATGKQRADQFMTPEIKKLKKGDKAKKINAVQEAVLGQCIDARLFGTTLPLEEGSLKVTGAVQISAFNRSLHRVAPRLVQQTAAFAGKEKAAQKSFAERQLLPYALIAAYGVCNENAARASLATDQDLEAMFRALWEGTNNLTTTSKMGHAALLLARVQYKDGKRLGQLAQRLKLETKVEDEALRSTSDYVLDVGELVNGLESIKDDVALVTVRQDDRLVTTANGKQGPLGSLLETAAVPAKVS